MTVFLCDGECEYSYDDLLRHLNQDNYFPLLKNKILQAAYPLYRKYADKEKIS